MLLTVAVLNGVKICQIGFKCDFKNIFKSVMCVECCISIIDRLDTLLLKAYHLKHYSRAVVNVFTTRLSGHLKSRLN